MYTEYYADYYETMQLFSSMMAVIFVILGIVLLANYILTAISYYKLAKTRNMPNPWLAWIPVVNSYTVGAAADHINKDYQKTTHRGVTLLVLDLISSFSGIIIAAVAIPMFFNLMEYAVIYNDVPEQYLYELAGQMMIIFIIAFVLLAVSIWSIILRYMSQYTVFKEYAPQSAGVYLAVSLVCQFVLSITFLPYIFVLVIYKKTPQFQVLNAARSYNYNYPGGYNNPGGPGQYARPNDNQNYNAYQQPNQANPYSYNQNPGQPQQPYQAPQQPYQTPQQPAGGQGPNDPTDGANQQ